MKFRAINTIVVCGLSALVAACDQTIHEYPERGESKVIVELNIDRTPPKYYKELIYDNDGRHIENLLDPYISQSYAADERLCLRIVTELYEIPDNDCRTDKGRLTARREISVDRLKDVPQDTLHFRLPEGKYRALTWADYAPKDYVTDWFFDTDALDAVHIIDDHTPTNNHYKSSAAGCCTFTVDFNLSDAGNVTVLNGIRSARAGSDIVPVYAERASGRFRLWATDMQDYINGGNRIEDLRIRLIYKQYVSAGYDVDTETPNAFVQSRTMEAVPSIVPGDGSMLLAYDYVLTSSDEEDHILIDIFIFQGNKEVNHFQNIDIPLRRNRETIVKGPFLTKTVGSGDIGIDEGFDDEYVVEIPD